MRRNDVVVRIFGAHDHEYLKLMADQRAADTAAAPMFACAVVDKLGLHTALTSDGWMEDRAKAQAIAAATNGIVVTASASGPRAITESGVQTMS